MPANAADGNLDDLVVSSGDFGRAYLTERWAARFVGELFSNYTVCFVGYSIDDPVLRYMTDALAADRLLGESPLEMFVFGSYSKGKKNERANEWKAKNVTPILYREYRRHWYLHKTLRAWAETYRDGISGKEIIVTTHAGSHPTKSTEEENFVDRMLWALSDSSGLPAKRFADLDPVPPLEWMETFSEDNYSQGDLSRFGVQPNSERNDPLKFSLIHRPSPYTHAPWMTLVDEGATGSEWDKVMFHLARWLMRHLDDPKLLLWLTRHGGQIRRQFRAWINQRLKELDQFERDGNTDELNHIRDNAPHAIPRPMMRVLWRLLLAGRMQLTGPGFRHSALGDILQWQNRFEHDGLTVALRLELRDMLTPRLSLREPISWDLDRGDAVRQECLNDLVDWKIVLSVDNVHPALENLYQNPRWVEALPDLLDAFSVLLRDSMDLARKLGGADDRRDRSYIYEPSIAAHARNVHLQDWTALIELTRDAWLATAEIAPKRARRIAENWSTTPYPVFRRLAFFAATQEGAIPPQQALDWLLADDHWWLWSMETEREVLCLLVGLSADLGAESLARLERVILTGPPRPMYKDDLEPEDWVSIMEEQIWLRLAKMDAVRVVLGTDAKAKLNEVSLRHPEWQLEPDGSDEFSITAGGSGDRRRLVAVPRRRRELVAWLKQNPGTDVLQNDDWTQCCQDVFPVIACALCALARDNIWPTARWRQALLVWSDERLIKRSWRYMAPVLAEGSRDQLRPLAQVICHWLQKVAQALDPDEVLFFRLCQAMLKLDCWDDANVDEDDPVTHAINHPVGYVTDAMLYWWTRSPLKDGQGLPKRLRRVFAELCNVRVGSFRHGRVLLASRVITLFRVDDQWTARHLLPLFDWNRSEAEARAAWNGFLWSPRFYRPLVESIKEPFLATASYYGVLDRKGAQYAAVLTTAALDVGDTFTEQELAEATEALPEDGLRYVAESLVRALEAAGKQCEQYWSNRVRPYMRSVWPNELDRKTPQISECLSRLCIAAGNAFPEALQEVRHWLQPPRYLGHLMRQLKESQVCSKFPEHAVDFLGLVIGDEAPLGDELGECLEQIRSAAPQLQDDPQFRKLRDLMRT